MFSLVVRGAVAAVVGVGLAGCGGGDGSGRPAGTGTAAVPAATTAGAVSPPATPRKKARVVVPAGVRAGYMVYDRDSRKALVHRGEHLTFRSASVVKILIALDYLGRHETVPAADLALLRPMLRSSDDKAATSFWKRGGQGAIVRRMSARIGLDDTAPPPASKPGFWGYTAISASDVVKMWRYLLEKAPVRDRDLVLGHLRKATPCGTDDFDQYFGIPRALPKPWAVKQGWSGFGDVPAVPCRAAGARSVRAAAPDLGIGRPVLHTTGLVGDRRIVAVLTLQPAGSGFQAAEARITELTRRVYRAAG
ncbi:hypothetical protein [Actinomadura parmotrematis]|uniref:Serine hydrolase n=1 Tax=Actinomadura parmotrematis TaxID=2864039 RepID=A0ABS7G0G0_9ACTN|nr:hypothetical protein [Actinomadura parmotrematis]MBW8486193.1 hypothetical protein [Actinomadura parmotrematis]